MEEFLKYFPVVYITIGLALGVWLAYPLCTGKIKEEEIRAKMPPVDKEI